jgi:hypothetical protein
MTAQPDGWDLLNEVLAVARDIDTGINNTGITSSELRAKSDLLAELSAAWKASLDAEFEGGRRRVVPSGQDLK